MLLLDEDLPGSITFRHYRAPGRRDSWRKRGVSGSIAITRKRVAVWTGGVKYIDVPHSDPLRAALDVSAEESEKVCFAFDAEQFRSDSSGRVEVRLRTAQADQIAAILAELA